MRVRLCGNDLRRLNRKSLCLCVYSAFNDSLDHCLKFIGEMFKRDINRRHG
jgi:hypothetical protein